MPAPGPAQESNFGMAIGVALIRFSGDPTLSTSFEATFNTFLGGATALLPCCWLLTLAEGGGGGGSGLRRKEGGEDGEGGVRAAAGHRRGRDLRIIHSHRWYHSGTVICAEFT